MPDPRVIIRGNLVMNEHVYRAVLDLPRTGSIDERAARDAEERIREFLVKAGYELARVEARAKMGHLDILIDEGQLDKVLLPKLGVFDVLRLRLEITLPYDVFNRPHLESQIETLKRKYGFEKALYTLVPARHVEHRGVQLENPMTVRGFDLIPEAHAYELHIRFEAPSWEVGTTLDVAFRGPDGFGAGVRYRGAGLFSGQDRFEVRSRASFRIQDVVVGPEGRRFVSTAGAGLSWYSPPLLSDRLRALVSLGGEYLSRQRLDLEVDSYDFIRLDPSLSLAAVFEPWVTFEAGAGIEYPRLLGVTLGPAPRARIDPPGHLRQFLLSRLEVVFDPDSIRIDQRHEARVEARYYPGPDLPTARVDVAYQKVFRIGWDELRLDALGSGVFGQAHFIEEVRVGEFVRGISSEREYASKIFGLAVGYRLSLARDYYKVGVFGEAAGYGGPKDLDGLDSLKGAFAVGASFHALLIDTFQLDVYFAVGFTSDGLSDRAISASLKQAF